LPVTGFISFLILFRLNFPFIVANSLESNTGEGSLAGGYRLSTIGLDEDEIRKFVRYHAEKERVHLKSKARAVSRNGASKESKNQKLCVQRLTSQLNGSGKETKQACRAKPKVRQTEPFLRVSVVDKASSRRFTIYKFDKNNGYFN
jgi:hypothetical protein